MQVVGGKAVRNERIISFRPIPACGVRVFGVNEFLGTATGCSWKLLPFALEFPKKPYRAAPGATAAGPWCGVALCAPTQTGNRAGHSRLGAHCWRSGLKSICDRKVSMTYQHPTSRRRTQECVTDSKKNPAWKIKIHRRSLTKKFVFRSASCLRCAARICSQVTAGNLGCPTKNCKLLRLIYRWS